MHDNFYTTKNPDDLVEDLSQFLGSYMSKGKGADKLKIFKDFLIENEKNMISYFIKQIE